MGESADIRIVPIEVEPAVAGRGLCPKCGSTQVVRMRLEGDRLIEGCAECQALWEPLPPGGAHMDDDGTPFPFPDPCDNCAFRPGSPEQQDTEGWKKLIASLGNSTAFYCHKGVPLAPGTDEGFAYPKKVDKVASKLCGEEVLVHDREQLRLCRGYLNMMSKRWAKELAEEAKVPEGERN